jgi:hypothetical protein
MEKTCRLCGETLGNDVELEKHLKTKHAKEIALKKLEHPRRKTSKK